MPWTPVQKPRVKQATPAWQPKCQGGKGWGQQWPGRQTGKNSTMMGFPAYPIQERLGPVFAPLWLRLEYNHQSALDFTSLHALMG